MYRLHLLMVVVMPFTLIMLSAHTYVGQVLPAIGYGVMALFWLVIDYHLWRDEREMLRLRLDIARLEGRREERRLWEECQSRCTHPICEGGPCQHEDVGQGGAR